VLHAAPGRGKDVFAFEYDTAWLHESPRPELDPRLHPTPGPQHVPGGRDNFGMFLDAAPDRWGRALMRRREAQLAREGNRAERRLTELDYLLGVFDGHRMGGLRFRIESGPFLDDQTELASPPWTSLRELEQASLALEREGAERSPKYGAWLRMLLAPGRSLGGARPKASVVDPKHQLWLAKFPSSNDEHDVGGWEWVVHVLADRAGVATADAQCAKYASRHHTFLTRRFDRTKRGARVHFASAMTMLDRIDGDDSASYLDLAEFLQRHGASASKDLEQLWRRIAFFACVSNVDDHLRNHGFLLGHEGWSLAPAYDMNPVAQGDGLLLNISETDNAQDLDLILTVAEHFRVKPRRAKVILDEVIPAVRTWREVAKATRLSRSEQDRMASAFRLAA